MGTKYLIDSNAIIDYLSARFSENSMSKMHKIMDAIPLVSIISKIEVLGYNAPKSEHNLLVDFFENTIILDLTEDVVEQTIQLRKNHKIKLPDAIIAATALTQNLTLITRNLKDFKSINSLKTKNFHEF